jgi:UDP-2,3-diacylglucosamine hydrolase
LTTLFISDLHLDAQHPAITDLFCRFLTERAVSADALYILGDLFEAWIGDDDDSELNQTIACALRQLSETGVALYFIHGNRDFLLGPAYAGRCDMQLLDETTVIDLYGEPTLIMHGDTLCTDDVDYQAFRTQVRTSGWQQQILQLPLEQRRIMALQLREDSRNAGRLKPHDITDVNQHAVQQVMDEQNVLRLIHGHTHRPAIHHFELVCQHAQRIVLGDWHGQMGSVLTVDSEGVHLEELTY